MNRCVINLRITIESGNDEFWEEVIETGNYKLVADEIHNLLDGEGYNVEVEPISMILTGG